MLPRYQISVAAPALCFMFPFDAAGEQKKAGEHKRTPGPTKSKSLAELTLYEIKSHGDRHIAEHLSLTSDKSNVQSQSANDLVAKHKI